jgi:hypothetical protein
MEVNYTKSLLENGAFVLGPIFHLYQIFLPPLQMPSFVPVGATVRYKWPLTWAGRGLLLATRYKCLTFVPSGGSARYECAGLAFIPGRATTRYKRGVICTGPNFAPVKKISHPLVRTPPRLSPLFSLPLPLDPLFLISFFSSSSHLSSFSLLSTGAREGPSGLAQSSRQPAGNTRGSAVSRCRARSLPAQGSWRRPRRARSCQCSTPRRGSGAGHPRTPRQGGRRCLG